jgi:hypothetical protein
VAVKKLILPSKTHSRQYIVERENTRILNEFLREVLYIYLFVFALFGSIIVFYVFAPFLID